MFLFTSSSMPRVLPFAVRNSLFHFICVAWSHKIITRMCCKWWWVWNNFASKQCAKKNKANKCILRNRTDDTSWVGYDQSIVVQETDLPIHQRFVLWNPYYFANTDNLFFPFLKFWSWNGITFIFFFIFYFFRTIAIAANYH